MTFYHTHPALCTILVAFVYAGLILAAFVWKDLKAAAHDDDNDAWRDSQGVENPRLSHCLKCGCPQDKPELCPTCRDILKGQTLQTLADYFNGANKQFLKRN